MATIQAEKFEKVLKNDLKAVNYQIVEFAKIIAIQKTYNLQGLQCCYFRQHENAENHFRAAMKVFFSI